mgnify:CR=1 FL=1
MIVFANSDVVRPVKKTFLKPKIDFFWERNHSINPWPIESFLASVGNHNNTMGAPNKVQIMDKSSLPEPGHWTIVCQLFKAPEETGIYMSYWRMHDSKNDAFGERFRVKIRVSA